MKPIEIVGDFETASACDLKKAGAWRYAQDFSTEVLCFSFGPLEGKRTTWYPWMPKSHPVAQELLALASNPDVMWIAHNAQFEKAVWRRIMVLEFDFPDIPNNHWHDTMAVCAMKQLPQKLEDAARVLRLPDLKDTEGSKITIALSKPNKRGYYDRRPETLARVGQYCEADVDSESGLHRRVGWLQPGERRVWLLDQTINERGVRLDMDFVRKCQEVVDRATVPLAAEFQKITGGITFNQNAKIKDWCAAQGLKLPNMQKETLTKVLGSSIDGVDDDAIDFSEDGPATLTDDTRRVLSIRQLIGSASVKKLRAMESCVCEDGRARGLLSYHRAGPGRWAGKLLQPQNFPRGTLTDFNDKSFAPDTIIEAIMTGDPKHVETVLGFPPVETVVGALRHSICSEEDNLLVAGDFSTIEARIVLALAGQHDKTELMAKGLDIYNDMATTIYKRPINRKIAAMAKEGQVGKNSVLGLGFQMGWKKFKFKYAPLETDEFCQNVVTVYRKEWAPKVPAVWYALEEAALKTVWESTPHSAYGVEYHLEDGWLTARLPSGRKLYYYNPQKSRKVMPWDADDVRPSWTYQAVKSGVWKTIDAYGGLLTENVVQALARDLMVRAMFLAEQNNLPIILTVHDEIVAETERWFADKKLLEDIMADRPEWAIELNIPVKAEAWAGPRYKK